MNKKEFSIECGGKTLSAEFSDLAGKTNGSMIVRYGNTAVLVTVVMSQNERVGIDYFPLTVDFEEKFYAAGQILGSRFVRRELKPSDEAILSGRVVDRTMRPFFDHHIRNEVQVVATVLSIDKEDPDILAINAASLALGVSDIPWKGPVSAVRISRKVGDKAFEINPTYVSREHAQLELEFIVAAKEGSIVMIEGWGREIPEEIAYEALNIALQEISRIEEFQKKIIKEIGKKKKIIKKEELSESAKKLFLGEISKKLYGVMWKSLGSRKLDNLKDEWLALLKKNLPDENENLAFGYYEENANSILHTGVLEHSKRPDGRGLDEVREIFAQAGGISSVLHGTGIFYRGETHILSVLTLGGPRDSQIIDGIEVKSEKRFMHHYNFPPYSGGETGRMGVNRRMIGHGALAERALVPILPVFEDFPYTIRVVSESMSSNGSTSMASVCAGTIAMLDGGVPIKSSVAGIAMGLMLSPNFIKDKKYKILTDIQGPEDHHGDMDFKVAGSKTGITALQLDIKVDGVPLSIIQEALNGANMARKNILSVMDKTLATPRDSTTPSAPKVIRMNIKPDQIGLVIGPGGKTINKIKSDTGADIDIEDDGLVFITGKNGGAEKARDVIRGLTHEYKVGERFSGRVSKIFDFGAIVEISSTTDGLVHISEIAPFRLEKVDSILKEGDMVPVEVKEIDKERGRISLSIKRADPEFADKVIASKKMSVK